MIPTGWALARERVPDHIAPTTNDWATAALASIREHALSLTPHNFAVWYEYHRGSLPELNRLIDILLSNKQGLDDARVTQIHVRFIGEPQGYLALRGTSQRIQQTITDVLGLLHDAGKGASRFGSAVRNVSGQFAAKEVSIEGLIRSLLAEAQDMVARTEQFEAELARNAELMKTMQRRLDDTRREALTDGLTGLANRRHFDETIQGMAGQAMNDGTELSLMLIDIDHFKRINDQWGHPVGDQVIQLIAATMRGNLRPNDFAARYGGEEFAVVMPATRIAEAAELGNRLREAFARHRVVLRDSRQPIGVITLSGGIANYRPGESLADWIGRADAALYAAKQGGRNRVVQAAPLPAA
jgi:diguanylate cyclase